MNMRPRLWPAEVIRGDEMVVNTSGGIEESVAED